MSDIYACVAQLLFLSFLDEIEENTYTFGLNNK